MTDAARQDISPHPRVAAETVPDAENHPYTEFPRGRGAGEIDDDKTAKMVKDKRCDAVIVGNAG